MKITLGPRVPTKYIIFYIILFIFLGPIGLLVDLYHYQKYILGPSKIKNESKEDIK